ncbi:hypothetical protein KIW84_062066 [Lathyrus oleraceus]|uniref:Uncharacterized protein n=1 Tax=Pisum sativum TaxID=3888 RepID=A0A9D4W7F3_PEA|nr:hypothetical protein KIW84_062066 [Pisum sativum]
MITRYTHQGRPKKAKRLLELVPDKLDTACWNAMIVGDAKKEWENEFGNAVFQEDGGKEGGYINDWFVSNARIAMYAKRGRIKSAGQRCCENLLLSVPLDPGFVGCVPSVLFIATMLHVIDQIEDSDENKTVLPPHLAGNRKVLSILKAAPNLPPNVCNDLESSMQKLSSSLESLRVLHSQEFYIREAIGSPLL